MITNERFFNSAISLLYAPNLVHLPYVYKLEIIAIRNLLL